MKNVYKTIEQSNIGLSEHEKFESITSPQLLKSYFKMIPGSGIEILLMPTDESIELSLFEARLKRALCS